MSRSGMQGFDESGFAVGSLFGVRWWNLGLPSPGRAWGNEPGPTLKGSMDFWQPGENIATCRHGGHVNYPPGLKAHDVPEEHCGCGFWAYWQQDASPLGSAAEQPVLGVIEGYGSTLIGTKGFRCQKARIVALSLQFRVMVADPALQSAGFDPSGMFYRGPQGRDAYEAIAGHAAGSKPGYIEDPVALSQIEDAVTARFGVPVYLNPGYMLARHPPTTDYLPKPELEPADEARLLLTLLQSGAITVNEARSKLDRLLREMEKELAALKAISTARLSTTGTVTINTSSPAQTSSAIAEHLRMEIRRRSLSGRILFG